MGFCQNSRLTALLGLSSKTDPKDLGDEWYDMEVLSEGEMGIELKPQVPTQLLTTPSKTPMHALVPVTPSKATEPSTHHSNTPGKSSAVKPEDKEDSPGTPEAPPALLPVTPTRPSTSSTMPPSCTQSIPYISSQARYMHNPKLPKAPVKPAQPCFMRSKKAAGNVPYEFEKLDDDSKLAPQNPAPESVKWIKAIDEVQEVIDQQMCNPHDIDPVDHSQMGLDFNTGKLPEEVYCSPYHHHHAHDDKSDAYDKCIQTNSNMPNQWSFSKYLADNNSLKWEDAIKDPQDVEFWMQSGHIKMN
ncbi:hypothetical protein FRC11_013720 [Ceratobasidium sp. 423]|nr:hypothetical protein FRC11_013720 [Ceratobasidium sp. 423]